MNVTTSVMSAFILLFGIIGFLLKREVFGRLDEMKKEIEILESNRASIEWCRQVHTILNTTMDEVKSSLRKNGDVLNQVAQDVAVLKDRDARPI